MFKKITQITLVVTIIIGWGCTTAPNQKRAHISGSFTVADSIDATKDYSGIGVTIIQKDSANANADTLFHALTDSNGTFDGFAHFEQKQYYPMLISRNRQNLGQTGVILADEDSVFVTGQLPDLAGTMTISSGEHKAFQVYQRLNRSFDRVMAYARAGKITGDTLRQELQKWSGLFWEAYEKNQPTIASEIAARKSVDILQGWNNKAMMERIRSVQQVDALSDLGATYGKNYLADSLGLDSALTYLDRLVNITEDRDKLRRIKMEQIKLLYDSARVEEAQKNLAEFKKQYADQSTKEWVESISYDLSYLSPGDSIPNFSFTQNGKTISRDSLLGSPYILEVTRLANSLYQRQFDRTVVIHSIYKNYGLQVITLPLDQSQVTLDAFFEERLKPWPVADAQAFDRDRLIKKFNIQLIPTRFLIDRKGNIVRKYVGNEYEDIITGIQTIIEDKKQPAS